MIVDTIRSSRLMWRDGGGAVCHSAGGETKVR